MITSQEKLTSWGLLSGDEQDKSDGVILLKIEKYYILYFKFFKNLYTIYEN